MRPFWLAGDCLLDALEGEWGDEGLRADGNTGNKGVGRGIVGIGGGAGGRVEEWARDFICFTLEGLAGEHEFVNLVDLGERFNRLTKNVYAGNFNLYVKPYF
jgi:hypothetical protein